MDHLTVGRTGTITASFDDDGAPVALASATVSIVDDLSNPVVVEATATVVADGPLGRATYQLLPSQLTDCTILTATWTGVDGDAGTWVTVTPIEVVGAEYFSLDDLRAMPDVDTSYSTEQLVQARDWSVGIVERECRTSFVERYHREDRQRRSCPDGRMSLVGTWVRRLVGITLDTYNADPTVLTTDDLASLSANHGKVTVISPRSGAGPLRSSQWDLATVRYVAGYATSPPPDLRSAMLDASRNYLIEFSGHSSIPARATSISSGDTTYGVRSAGKGRPTGYDRVDATINEWRSRVRAQVRGL